MIIEYGQAEVKAGDVPRTEVEQCAGIPASSPYPAYLGGRPVTDNIDTIPSIRLKND